VHERLLGNSKNPQLHVVRMSNAKGVILFPERWTDRQQQRKKERKWLNLFEKGLF